MRSARFRVACRILRDIQPPVCGPAPDKISFRTGGVIAALIGLLFMPWKILATSGGYLFTWLGGYGTLLGARRSDAGVVLARADSTE